MYIISIQKLRGHLMVFFRFSLLSYSVLKFLYALLILLYFFLPSLANIKIDIKNYIHRTEISESSSQVGYNYTQHRKYFAFKATHLGVKGHLGHKSRHF